MRQRVYQAALVVILTGWFGVIGQAQAVFYDGNKLMEDYKEYKKASTSSENQSIVWVSDGLFMGYVQGVSDALDSKICWPAGEEVKLKAVCAIVGNYLEAHPEEWGKSGDVIVLKALKKAYPCIKKGRP